MCVSKERELFLAEGGNDTENILSKALMIHSTEILQLGSKQTKTWGLKEPFGSSIASPCLESVVTIGCSHTDLLIFKGLRFPRS